MSIVRDILNEEKKRLLELKDNIENQIGSLPKGSLSKKKRGNNWFVYLAYREEQKVKFKYIGKDKSDRVLSINDSIIKRKKLEEKLKNIKLDLKEVKRGLSEKQ